MRSWKKRSGSDMAGYRGRTAFQVSMLQKYNHVPACLMYRATSFAVTAFFATRVARIIFDAYDGAGSATVLVYLHAIFNSRFH